MSNTAEQYITQSPDSSLAEKLFTVIESFEGVFDLKKLYQFFPEEKPSTIRGRVYRELIGKGLLERTGKGMYAFVGNHGEKGLILNGDARNLQMLQDESIELIIADHPYEIQGGTNRSFNSSYEESSFRYTLKDFQDKARVLKDGAFLVEFLPEMKETNLEYLMGVLQDARSAGFNFYCKVSWFKAEIRDGKLVDGSAFVGRKAVTEEIYISSKGSPRKLRERRQGDKIQNERGAKSMFPAIFMEPTIHPKKRIHKAQKPISLLKKIILALTNENETVLDQFAGSFVTFWAAIATKRKAIAIELSEEFVQNQLSV